MGRLKQMSSMVKSLGASDMSAVERLSPFRRFRYYTVYEDMAFSFQISAYCHFSNSVEWWPHIAWQ